MEDFLEGTLDWLGKAVRNRPKRLELRLLGFEEPVEAG